MICCSLRNLWPSQPVAILLLLGLAACAMPTLQAAEDGKGKNKDEQAEEEEPPRHAYLLGNFRLKNFRPVEREKITLTFTVYAEVEDAHHEQFDFELQSKRHRVRNQIITSARLVSPNDFDDPALKAFRRRIYLRLRRAVPELKVKEIYISDFSYIRE